MASVPVTELKLGICISSPLSPTLQSPHNAVAEISVARLINLYFMLIWCVMSLSEKKVFIVELRLICFQRPAPPLTRYANCIKKQGRQHILQRLKICQIYRRLGWPCSGESCLLKNSWKNLFEWWAMRKERGLCWESPVSTSRLSEPGLGPAKFRSGLRRLRARVGLRTPVFNLEWVTAIFLRPMSPPRGSGKQPRLLLSKAVSILTRVFVAPIRNKRLCCYFPDDCVLMISFLTQAEKLQFHKEPVILINVLPGLSVAEFLSKLFCQ